jgi:hypothetical protein
MESPEKMRKVSFSAVIRKEGINPYVDPPLGTGEKLGKRGVIPVKVWLDPSTVRRSSPRALLRAGGKAFRANLMPLGAKRTKESPGKHHRLYLHGIMRKMIGKDTGDKIKVVLELDSKPRVEPMNPGLARALRKDSKAKKVFEGLSPSHQKELKRYLNHLKSQEALQRNVDKVMAYLRKSQARWFGKKKPVKF